MFLHYLNKKENKEEDEYNKTYTEIINITKILFSNKFKYAEKTFDLTFEVFTIIIFTTFYSLNNYLDKKSKNIKQNLMNLFIKDLDHSFRLSGIADMRVGKHVKLYVKKFYFRVSKLNQIFENNDCDEFYQYLITFNIVKKGQFLDESQSFYTDLKILINRVKKNGFKNDIFKDLFN